MAILLFTAIGTVIAAAMLVSAANAFTVCVAVPAWKRYSIVAPVAVLVIAAFVTGPFGLLILQLQDHMFLVGERFHWALLLAIPLSILALALVCATAWAATLLCRAILEFLPPILTAFLGLQPALLLQAVLLVGAVASGAVQLTAFLGLAYWLRDKPPFAISASMLGIAASILCFRVLTELSAPQGYAPHPVPPWIKSVLLQTSRSTPNESRL